MNKPVGPSCGGNASALLDSNKMGSAAASSGPNPQMASCLCAGVAGEPREKHGDLQTRGREVLKVAGSHLYRHKSAPKEGIMDQ